MTTRRRFMALLGVGTAAGPLAAKQVLDASVSDLTTLRGYSAAALAPGADLHGLDAGMPAQTAGDSAASYANSRRLMSTYLRVWGKPPDHVDDIMRRSARYVQALDPDIAAKRSWSMSVKIQEQRQRNYERELERYRTGGAFETMKEGFRNLTGFDWSY